VAKGKGVLLADVVTPRSYRDVTYNAHKEQWMRALESELESLEERKVFEKVDIPVGMKLMGGPIL
jgi:hypothetical protein